MEQEILICATCGCDELRPCIVNGESCWMITGGECWIEPECGRCSREHATVHSAANYHSEKRKGKAA